MLPHLSDIFAPPEFGPAEWARALAGRHPLVLAPSSSRGWFGGRVRVAWDPAEIRSGLRLAQAGEALQAAFDGETPGVCAALATYEGACTVMRYEGGVELAEDGWRQWGAPQELPATPDAAGRDAAVDPAFPLLAEAHSDMDARQYRAAVREVRERIAAGDVYVLNLTYRMEGRAAVDPAQAFAALLDRAGSDFSALLELPNGGALASVSPERFLRVRDVAGTRTAEIWPIKGTRPRGASPQSDVAFVKELLHDTKERAEHVMVVDLERNDLGRVCVPGTVRVDPLYEVVPTPYCHQLVSAVHGELRADARFGELLQAAFPCGSVTGAPKSAAMRIARELEPSPRGAYCGALLVAMSGELDSSVLIRTLEYLPDPTGSAAGRPGFIAKNRRTRWGTGCGITIESDPAAEWLESVLKTAPVAGDGPPAVTLLETCRIAFGRVPLLDRHLARLAAGGCGPSLLALARERVTTALEAIDSALAYGRLRVLVHPNREVEAVADSRLSTLDVDGGPALVLHSIARAPELPRGAAKPAERSLWDLAHAAAAAKGGQQAVLTMPDGTLVDGSTATLWLRFGDTLLTPHAPPAVDGVGRGVVYDLAPGLGYKAGEAGLTAGDLERAEEVLLSNALAGVVPVRGRGGSAAKALRKAFDSVWLSASGR